MLTRDPFAPTPGSADYNDQTKRRQKRADGFNPHFADMVAYMDKLADNNQKGPPGGRA